MNDLIKLSRRLGGNEAKLRELEARRERLARSQRRLGQMLAALGGMAIGLVVCTVLALIFGL